MLSPSASVFLSVLSLRDFLRVPFLELLGLTHMEFQIIPDKSQRLIHA
jgi:hypothetical protein